LREHEEQARRDQDGRLATRERPGRRGEVTRGEVEEDDHRQRRADPDRLPPPGRAVDELSRRTNAPRSSDRNGAEWFDDLLCHLRLLRDGGPVVPTKAV
jgi:hypothetical protein